MVYEVMGLLPLNAGAVHETETVVLPRGLVVTAVADTDCGAEGGASATPDTRVWIAVMGEFGSPHVVLKGPVVPSPREPLESSPQAQTVPSDLAAML